MENKSDFSIGGTIPQRITSCLEQMDKLLKGPEPIVASMMVAEKFVKNDTKAQSDTLRAIMNIMSIKDLKTISLDSKLSDLGMDSLMAVEINQILERDFELFLSPKELRSITFTELNSKSLTNSVKPTEETHKATFNMFFKTLGKDDGCHKDIVSLSSKSEGPDAILFVPGIEGVSAKIWETVAHKMEVSSYLLQYRKTGYLSDVSLIAQSVTKDVMKTVFNKTHYYRIVGYSFGSLLALELAKQFEEKGMCGAVVLIDGAPKFLRQAVHLIADCKGDFSENDAKRVFLQILSPLFQSSNVESFVEKSWDATWITLIDGVNKDLGYSKLYLEEIFKSVLARIKLMAAIKDPIKPFLESDILLIRPKQSILTAGEDDYGLSTLTNGRVIVKFLDGNHSTVVDNPELHVIINDALINNNFDTK